MFHFFDYAYYRICKAYYKTRDSNPKIAGLCIITLMHFFNILSLFCLFCISIHEKIYINKLLALLVILTLMILNGIHYNKFHYGILQDRWQEEDRETQVRKGGMVVAYIILSTVIGIGLAIYLGSKKW